MGHQGTESTIGATGYQPTIPSAPPLTNREGTESARAQVPPLALGQPPAASAPPAYDLPPATNPEMYQSPPAPAAGAISSLKPSPPLDLAALSLDESDSSLQTSRSSRTNELDALLAAIDTGDFEAVKNCKMDSIDFLTCGSDASTATTNNPIILDRITKLVNSKRGKTPAEQENAAQIYHLMLNQTALYAAEIAEWGWVNTLLNLNKQSKNPLLKVNINAQDVRWGSVDCVDKKTEDSKLPRHKATMLSYAAAHDNMQAYMDIFRQGANPYIFDVSGARAPNYSTNLNSRQNDVYPTNNEASSRKLVNAVHTGNITDAKEALAERANPIFNRTPLVTTATIEGTAEMLELLLRNYASSLLRVNGKNPIQSLVSQTRLIDMTKLDLLLNQYAENSYRREAFNSLVEDGSGNTILLLAVKTLVAQKDVASPNWQQKLDIINKLTVGFEYTDEFTGQKGGELKAKLDVVELTGSKNSPLHILVETLAQAEKSKDKKDKSTVEFCKKALVMLLERGANPDIKRADDTKDTPLLTALKLESKAATEILLALPPKSSSIQYNHKPASLTVVNQDEINAENYIAEKKKSGKKLSAEDKYNDDLIKRKLKSQHMSR